MSAAQAPAILGYFVAMDDHEFTEDVADASMCVCGVPAISHDAVYPPQS